MNDSTIRRNLEACGLGAFADRILAHALPSIVILLGGADQDQISQNQGGQSRIGGLPDLPASIAWPLTTRGEAMDFALQINLADLPAVEGLLPGSGMLYVFIGRDEPATNIEHRIMIHSGDEPLLQALPPAGVTFANALFANARPHLLGFVAAPDFPRWATRDHDAVTQGMSEEQGDAYREDFLWSLEPNEGHLIVGKLLGHASGIGNDPREDAHIVREVNPKWLHKYSERARLDMSRARQWRNFLMIDSCMQIDLHIWDAGYIQVLMHQADLAALDFSRTYAAISSS